MNPESPPSRPLTYRGYERPQVAEPDTYLTSVRKGTPGGEYLRRFWHPVGFVHELKDVPVRVKALGEDLVIFRDGGGHIGCLHLHCAHRRTSLEFGIVSDKGLRCCYHGWRFDVDGTILDIPGQSDIAKISARISQGAYPVHVKAGLVFVYMGPPEKTPPFPDFERFNLAGVTSVPNEVRFPYPCNWVQVKENAMDPAHTAVLHAIPQMRSNTEHFANEFGVFPVFTAMPTPNGMMYVASRKVGDKVWVRSTEYISPTVHGVGSNVESGAQVKSCTAPYRTTWTLPVDDDYSINFCVSHIQDGDTTPPEQREYQERFGQTDERPYRERQLIPGDYDAMVSEGPVNVHALENLAASDVGVVLFRRILRREIQNVERGEDPAPFQTPIRTYCNNRVVPVADVAGDANDPAVLRELARQVGESYLVRPPLMDWEAPSGKEVVTA